MNSQDAHYQELDVSLYACGSCGLFWLDPSPLGEVDYTHVRRNTSRQLPSYKDHLIKRITDYAGADGSVVEVGANDGSFARLLLQKAKCRRVLAIEPSAAFGSHYVGANIEFITEHLSSETASKIRNQFGLARVIICRHTLEHNPDPFDFLRALVELLDDEGMLVVEVPDSSAVADRYALHEIWDEHLFYFNGSNLPRLLAQVGIAVVESRRYAHLDAHNLVFYARKGDPSTVLKKAETLRTGFDLKLFATQLEDIADGARTAARNWERPVISLGASHPQTNFLSLTGAGTYVDFLVDDDAGKQERFVPVAGTMPLPVVSLAHALSRIKPRTIVLSAFGYPSWIARVREEFAGRDVSFAEPYCKGGQQHG